MSLWDQHLQAQAQRRADGPTAKKSAAEEEAEILKAQIQSQAKSLLSSKELAGKS